MASRYWVGGTAAWDGTAGSKWALTSGGAGGQAVPTSADDVFFTNLSTGTCTISAGNTGAKSIDCTGFTGTLGGTANIAVSGNITLVSGMTFSPSNISVIATSTITFAGKNIGTLAVNGAGITVTQADAATITSLTVTAGTYTTANFTLTAGSVFGTGTSTRGLTLGSSTVTVSGTWFMETTGLTISAGTSTISISSASTTFYGAGKTYNNVSFTSAAATTLAITGANTFNTLTLTATAGAGVVPISFDSTQTITTMVCNGASEIRRIWLQSDTIGTARTITATTWTTFTYLDFRDITLTNAKSGTSIGNCLGNTGITFSTAKTVYWNLTGAVNWSSTGWATSSGGTPAVANFPLAQDTAVFDNTGAATTVTLNSGWNVGTVNASARTSAVTFSFSGGNAIFSVYGNWSNGTGVTHSGTGLSLYFSGRTTQTITSNGKSFSVGIFGSGVSNTITLADALTCTAFTLSGTTGLSLGSNTLTCTSFANSSTSTRTLALGTGSITVTGNFNATSTGLTVTGSATISLTSATAKTFAGGGVNYGSTINQGGAGALTITGANTFSNITNTYGATGATSILFTAGTTTTFSNWNASGTIGNLLTIGSVTAASHTLSKASGTVNADYLSISRSTATGGATWNAGANSTNGGNNSGWIFPSTATGSFLMFF